MIGTDPLTFCRHLLIAGALGMAVGLERERVGREGGNGIFAGIRTFAIGGVLGCVAAILSQELHPLLFPVVFIVCGVLAAISYARDKDDRPGVTTEAAFLLIVLIGGMVPLGYELQAAVVTLALAALLAYKPVLKDFADRVSQDDIASTLKFGVVSLVVLPILPNRTYDPWQALNPHHIWLMVVLMAGISFAGYLLVKILGPRAGIGLTGFLGGLVSSTATTLAFSQRSREAGTERFHPHFALAAALAGTVMYPRLLFEAAVVHPAFAARLMFPLGAALGVGAVLVFSLYRSRAQGEQYGSAMPDLKNPFEVMPAVKLAAVFAVVVLVFRYTQQNFGSGAVLLAAFLSGLTDTDAVVLSMARASQEGTMPMDLAAASVVTACVANTIVKAGILMGAGVGAFRSRAVPPLVAMGVAAAAIGLWGYLAG